VAQVFADGIYRISLQSIVAAKLDDDDIGLVPGQRPRQAGPAARGGLATDAGVDDAPASPLRQACRQQTDPTFSRIDAIASTDTVAHDQNPALFPGMVPSRQGCQEESCQDHKKPSKHTSDTNHPGLQQHD